MSKRLIKNGLNNICLRKFKIKERGLWKICKESRY